MPGIFAQHLNGIKDLGELTLNQVVGLEADFFRHLGEPVNITTMKMNALGVPRIDDLGSLVCYRKKLLLRSQARVA